MAFPEALPLEFPVIVMAGKTTLDSERGLARVALWFFFSDQHLFSPFLLGFCLTAHEQNERVDGYLNQAMCC